MFLGGFNVDCVMDLLICKEGFIMLFWFKVYSIGYVMLFGFFINYRNGFGY